jgi:hypothetical protein
VDSKLPEMPCTHFTQGERSQIAILAKVETTA